MRVVSHAAMVALVLLLPVGACAQGSGDAASGASADAAAPPPGPRELEALWRDGVGFGDFLDAVGAREATWRANHRRAEAPPDLLARLNAAGGSWRLLAVAEDWCGDSAHNVPYLAALAAAAPSLELRVVGSEAGRAVMEAHRTPDGRAATPTVLLLDADAADRGCFVERPPALQKWVLSVRDSVPADQWHRELIERYEADAGRATLEELVTIVESAARGERRCVASTPAPEARR